MASACIPEHPPSQSTNAESPKKAATRKRFVGSSSRPSKRQEAGQDGEGRKQPVRRVANLIPENIMEDEELNEAIKCEQELHVRSKGVV